MGLLSKNSWLVGHITSIARCGLLLQKEQHGLSVCLSVGHVREPCKNGLTDPDAIWRADSCGPRKPCIRCGPDTAKRRSNFGGRPAQWTALVSHRCTVRCKKSITASQSRCCGRLQCCRLFGVTSHCSPVKNPPTCDAAFHENSLTACSVLLHFRGCMTPPPQWRHCKHASMRTRAHTHTRWD